MWKKIGVIVIALISTFSVAYGISLGKLQANTVQLSKNKDAVISFERFDRILTDAKDPSGKSVINRIINDDTVITDASLASGRSAVKSVPITNVNATLSDNDLRVMGNYYLPDYIEYRDAYTVQEGKDFQAEEGRPIAVINPVRKCGVSTCYPVYKDGIPADSSVDYLTSIYGANKFRTENVAFALEENQYSLNGLKEVGQSNNSGLKIRLKDSGLTLNRKEVSINNNGIKQKIGNSLELQVKSKKTLDFTYEQATIGENQYVSVLITKDQKLTHFGRMKAISNSTDTITLDFSDFSVGEYTILLVNEKLSTSAYATSSAPETFLTLKIVDSLTDITHNVTPQNNGSVVMDHLESGVNIADKQVATAVAKINPTTNAPYNVNYEVINASGTSVALPFEFRNDSDGKTIKDSAGNAIIYGKSDLAPGIYKFRIRAYDDNNDPASLGGHGIDKNGNEVLDSSYGLISDEIEIIVYPNKDTIKVDVAKNADSPTSNYTVTDVNSATTPINLATAKLDPDPYAGDSPTFDASMAITYSLKDIKLNGSAVTSGVEDFQIDANTGKITKKGTISYGKHEFGIAVTYRRNGKSITIDKGAFNFFIDPDIYFVNPKTPSEKITTQTVKYIYTDSNHDFEVMAKSSSTEIANKISYRVKQTDTSGTVTYKKIGANNTGVFTANKLGTATIEAYYKEGEVEIVVKELTIKVVVDALSDLSFTPTPQKDSTDKDMTYFAYQINAKKDQQVGTISSKFGAKPITYELLDTTKFYLKPNSDSAALPTQPYECDASGNPIVYAKEELAVGVYTFKLRAYDAMNEPFFEEASIKYGIDKEGNKVTGYDKGLISDEYTLVVYPNESQLTYTQTKKDMGTSGVSDDEFFTTKDINETDKKLGLIEFAGNAYIQTLKDEGYTISTVELLAKGTSTPLTELQAVADLTNANKYDIKKKGTVTSGTKNFDIKITFKDSKGTTTAIILKSDQSFYIAPELQYVNPDKTTEFLSKNEYTKAYDPEDVANDFTLIATDKNDYSSNSNVKYCILKDGVCDSATNAVITLVDHGNGTSTISAKAPGTENKEVTLRAYTQDAKGVLQTKKDIKIIIQPATQTLSWTGTDIQTKNNNIVKDDAITSSTGYPTWQLKLKYEEPTSPVTPNLNEYALVKAYDKTTVALGSIGIRSNVQEDTTTPNTPTLEIDYTVMYDQPIDDSGKIDSDELKNGKLVIEGELLGNATIIATAKATGNYGATIDQDDASTELVEIIGSATLRLDVSSKPKVAYKADYEQNIVSGGEFAKGTKSLGTLSLDNKDTSYTYKISKAEVYNELKTEEAKKNDPLAKDVYDTYPLSNFIIKSNTAGTLTDQLFVNSASLSNGLPKGIYQVSIDASKTVNGVKEEAISKVITIIVENKEINTDKLKWQSKDDVSGAVFDDTGGKMVEDTTSKQLINNVTLTKTYHQDSKGANGYFYVQVVDNGGIELTGASISYEEVSGTDKEDIIDVALDGKVTMLSASPSDILVHVKATIKKSGYTDRTIYLPIIIEKGISNFNFVNQAGVAYSIKTTPSKDGDPYVYEALLDASSKAYTFEKDKVLDVLTANAPRDADVTIKIVSRQNSTGNDVLKFKEPDGFVSSNEDSGDKVCTLKKEDYEANRDSKCLVQIEHALKKYKGSGSDLNKIVLIAVVSESANYKAKQLEMPVNIMPATQDDFDFKESTLPLDSVNEFTAVTPVFKNITNTSKVGDGKIILYTSNPDDADDVVDSTKLQIGDPDANAMLTYKDGINSIKYNIMVSKDDPEDSKTVYIYAVKEASRDYLVSDVKKQAWEIAKEGTSRLSIDYYAYENASDDVDTGFKKTILYGDAYFRLEASTSDDTTEDPPTYTYTIDDASKEYLETYGTNGNEFKALKAGNAYINVLRKANGQTDIKKKYMVTIAKRPVKLKVADVTKKSGMSVVVNDYTFTETSDSFLEEDEKKLTIEYSCQDSGANEVTTLTNGIRMIHNNLPIKATIKNKDNAFDVLSNYKITYLDGKTQGIENGKLIISEEESGKTWYEVSAGSQVNEKNETIVTNKGLNDWYNGNVDVLIKPASQDYDLIGNDANANVWDPIKFSVVKEGSNQTNIYFRKSTGDEKGAISKPQMETIKIDKTAPVVKEIQATLTHTDKFSKLINTITFGVYMKPGEEVSIKTEDIQVDKKIEVSSTKDVTDGISYKVYELDDNGNRGALYVPSTTEDSDSDGNFVFNLEDPGKYEVCVVAKDQAGNASAEKCEKLLVKKIDIDIDKDGDNEFIDSDTDGCPDINILLKDKDGNDYKVNVDLDKDNVPDLNIDSDGDGIADINVDTDEDEKPDLNLLIITKAMWKPEYCVIDQSDQYCTVKGLDPIINIDTDNDGVPDIDIDNKGDFKPHLNISKDGETPFLNVVKLHEWKPGTDYKKDNFVYDSIGVGEGNPKAETNIDTNDDGIPDVNIDFDGDGKEEVNIDTDGDGIPDVEIDGDGDGIPDINLDSDDDGKPDKDVIIIDKWDPILKGDKDGFIFGTTELKRKEELEDSGIIIGKPGGAFLPNFAFKVTDVTEKESAAIKDKIKDIMDDQIIKNVLDVNLWKDGTQVQPDGTIRVKVPVDPSWKNPNFVIELKDGTFQKIDGEIKDGYFVYDTDYLGKLTILEDDETTTNDPTPDPDDKKDPTTDKEKPSGDSSTSTPTKNPDTSVKGTYTKNAYGGALTGDNTNINSLMSMGIFASSCLVYIMNLILKRKKRN